MLSSNLHVLNKVYHWLSLNHRVWLVTITKTWGASPRPIGSLFAYNSELGKQVGSISGGCIEDDLIEELSSARSYSPPIVKIYGENPEEIERYKLPCGGKIEIVVESLNYEFHSEHFCCVLDSLANNQNIGRLVDLRSGRVRLVDHEKGEVLAKIENSNLVHYLGPVYRVLLVGAGEVARHLVDLFKSLEIDVCLCDPREEFLERHDTESWGIEVLHSLPDDQIRSSFSDRHAAIVALSHDPRVDDMALMEAVESDVFYIGAMGSVHTTEKRFQRLKSLGFGQEKLDRIDAPIGLPIMSKTPAEIAISIAARIIQVKNSICSNKTTINI